MNIERMTKLLQSGALVEAISLNRYTLYCTSGRYIIHDDRRKKAVDRVVFFGRDEAEALDAFERLAGTKEGGE